MRVVKSTPEEQHADQDKCRGNRIANKVIAMDALTATEPGVFVINIKTIPARFHLTNQPRQKSSMKVHQRGSFATRLHKELTIPSTPIYPDMTPSAPAASKRSRGCVNVTAMTFMPAALPAWIPGRPSSKTTQSFGATPISEAANKKHSGSGFER